MGKYCEKYQRLFYLGVGSDLPSEIQIDFEKHLQGCKECRDKFENLIRIHKVFKQTQQNLSKLESCSNLESVRKINFRKMKSKMQLSRNLHRAYILRPLVASLVILAISLFILFFANNKRSDGNSNPMINSPSAKMINHDRISESVSKNGDITEIYKKNDIDSNFYELTMKYSGTNLGHYLQGSCMRNISSSSYVNTTNDVEVELDSEESKRPVGLKPMKTKVECNLNDKNSEEFDF